MLRIIILLAASYRMHNRCQLVELRPAFRFYTLKDAQHEHKIPV